MSQSSPLLEIRNLALERDQRLLFTGLSMALGAGEILQVLGPNGAGKTSLLRVLATVSNDVSGDILFQGKSIATHPWDYTTRCLYLGHMPGIKKALTPLENLRWYTAQLPVRMAIEEALARVGLAGDEDTACYQLSAGQLRRVALARLYLSHADVWILDEPFTAIDKPGVKALESLMLEQSGRGGLVILTSHQDLNLPGLRQLNLLDYRPVPAGRYASGEKA